MQNLPAGVRMPEYGDAEYMNEMFNQFGMAMGFGVLMVLVVLVLLFRDFLQPVTIITALPLSLGGALGGLLLYGAALDLSSVIGILMLMGIVTKNSILLVDFIIEKRRHGMARARAIYRSGAERARPIIMTSIAMGAGMTQRRRLPRPDGRRRYLRPHRLHRPEPRVRPRLLQPGGRPAPMARPPPRPPDLGYGRRQGSGGTGGKR